ncbi:MAG: PRC-barrel domain-containing protein [Lautropia sp.]
MAQTIARDPVTNQTRVASGVEPTPLERTSPRLISSDRVEDTKVYGADHKRIGSIHHLMIEKVSGRVAYAIMSFGGFLGMGKDFYPVPWNSLSYDVELDGYVTNVTREQVEASPPYTAENFDWANDDWHARVHAHYQTKPSYIGYM